MSERNYSTNKYVSNRELLCKATAQDTDGHYELVDLYKYLGIVQKIEDEREEIQWLSKQKGTETSIKECENKIVQYNIQLSKMESEYTLRYLIKRLREKEEAEQEIVEREEKAPQEVQQKKTDKPKKSFGIKTKHLSKRTIIIASCVILGIAVIASAVALISSMHTEESEYTITFYGNRGIYFYTNARGEERMVTKYQDNTVYKVETFSSVYPSEPTPPTHYEYVFLGWYKNPECTDKFLFGKDEVNSNINLYAKWGK